MTAVTAAVRLAALALAVCSIVPRGYATPGEAYRLPPQAVVDLVDAPPTPSVALSPDGAWMLIVERDALPSIADLSRPMLRLAGMRIDPAANARHRTSYGRALGLRRRDPGSPTLVVPLPAGSRLADASWSHDSTRFLFTVVTATGSELWTATVDEPTATVRVSQRLNAVTAEPALTADASAIVVAEVPADRGPEPTTAAAPSGPNVQETSGERSPLRTYQDLLANPADEALFEHYATAQLVLVSFATGERTALGKPGIYSGLAPSPDGEYLLVTRTKRPFSYLMPWSSFASSIEVWDRTGKCVDILADLPPEENVPIGGVREGPRDVVWKPGLEAKLVYVEALDGGDPKREVAHRDRWSMYGAPFEGGQRELFRIEHRAVRLQWLADPQTLLATEYDRDRRWVRVLMFDMGAPTMDPMVWEDRSVRDRYGDPGDLVSRLDEHGHAIVLQDGPWVFRAGTGASPEGLLPFLDMQHVGTLETRRLWRCEPGAYESVVTVFPGGQFVTRHETPSSPPNHRLRTRDSEDVVALTAFEDASPELQGVTKELVTYERADGVPLSATLYLPAGYERGTRLPLLVWAYPLEFNDPATAGQVSSSPWRYTRVAGTSHLALLTQGYAILDGATMPVIGDPETMNDTFVEQIVAAAEAAVLKADALGVADPTRVAVGGHSYGAFMTANLLAHSDLFRAGVARSGAYNRTLTPFGFQSERRTLWEAPDAYAAVSPFFHAHRIQEPLLLIHGEIDSNSGTYPMQSERLFQAIKGLGGKARLVMLPNESHGYSARESVLHVHAETIEWLDRYVKHAPPGPAGDH